MNNQEFVKDYLNDTIKIAETIQQKDISDAVSLLQATKDSGGRLFILGVGGSAANASHAVNDFRKIGGMEAYAPTDNPAEMTARINDEGWETVFEEYLKISRIGSKDIIMVFSVGGGSPTTSKNLVNAMNYAQAKGTKIISIVSRDGGHAKKISDVCILIPVIKETLITPHAEGWQGIIWHLMVNRIE